MSSNTSPDGKRTRFKTAIYITLLVGCVTIFSTSAVALTNNATTSWEQPEVATYEDARVTGEMNYISTYSPAEVHWSMHVDGGLVQPSVESQSRVSGTFDRAYSDRLDGYSWVHEDSFWDYAPTGGKASMTGETYGYTDGTYEAQTGHNYVYGNKWSKSYLDVEDS